MWPYYGQNAPQISIIYRSYKTNWSNGTNDESEVLFGQPFIWSRFSVYPANLILTLHLLSGCQNGHCTGWVPVWLTSITSPMCSKLINQLNHKITMPLYKYKYLIVFWVCFFANIPGMKYHTGFSKASFLYLERTFENHLNFIHSSNW